MQETRPKHDRRYTINQSQYDRLCTIYRLTFDRFNAIRMYAMDRQDTIMDAKALARKHLENRLASLRERPELAGAAVEHGLRLAAEGADILDVGGESTRPRWTRAASAGP